MHMLILEANEVPCEVAERFIESSWLGSLIGDEFLY